MPEDVVRDVVNLNLILASQGDREEVLLQLLSQQRRLLHQLRLIGVALEELCTWLGVPLTAVPFNGNVMAGNIMDAIQHESQFGSAPSSSRPSRLALTPTVMLMPSLPQSTQAIRNQFPQSTSWATIAGYRRRLWQAHVREVHEWEGLQTPQGDAESRNRDEQLFLIQRDEGTAVGFIPEGERIPGWRRLDRRGATARRRGHGPRPRPLLRERPPAPRPPADAPALDRRPVPRLPRRHRERSRSRDDTRMWGFPQSDDEDEEPEPEDDDGVDREPDA